MDQFDPYAAQGHFQQQTCSDWLLNCLNHVKCDVIKLKDVRFLLLLPLAAVDVCRFPKSLQRLYQWEWHKEEHHFLFLYWSVQHLEHYRSKHCCRNRPSGLQAVTLARSSDPSSSCKLNLTSHCISLLPLRKHSGPVLPVPAPFSIYKCGQNFISLNAAVFSPTGCSPASHDHSPSSTETGTLPVPNKRWHKHFTKSRHSEGCHYVVQSALTAPPGRPDAGGGFKTSRLLSRSNQRSDFKHKKKLACIPVRNTSECSLRRASVFVPG